MVTKGVLKNKQTVFYNYSHFKGCYSAKTLNYTIGLKFISKNSKVYSNNLHFLYFLHKINQSGTSLKNREHYKCAQLLT